MYRFATLAFALLVFPAFCFSQTVVADSLGPKLPLAAQPDYQPTPEKTFNLVHTRLQVQFDYAKRRMPGKAWVTVKPHFYPSSQLVLDAKGMQIHEIAMVNGKQLTPLHFDYSDSLHLRISLGKNFTRNEQLTVYIRYTACPDEMTFKGSTAITNAKGLYFINPDGKDTTKPIQIWTQGETEATSVWCPTIDKPNQHTTLEISMQVAKKYVTLSNGLLVKQTPNADGTRTDTWKMDQPLSPYLFFMGVGDYAIVKDKYKTLPVDYYVEKKEAPLAKAIFGETTAMIGFYEKILGIKFPWKKYAQIVGRDYVSGAMENTTATLHGSAAYQNQRQLKDENKWEYVVAHELFHQWFGDLATAESWSNITVNESMADYSEYLWLEHKYGKEKAIVYNQEAMQQYMNYPGSKSKHLVRFQYDDKEDVFDVVSYQKGGRIQNMLRHFLGDSAYFKGLNLYLKQNQYRNGEAHQLRLAMEEVSGKDLNWFFDQWYFNYGHPKVQISFLHNDTLQTSSIIVKQLQKDKLFYLPLEVDVYTNNKPSRLTYWIGKQPIDTISLHWEVKPDWLDADPDRVMLWEKEIKQPEDSWLRQASLATNPVAMQEVLTYLEKKGQTDGSWEPFIYSMLKHPFEGNRSAILMWLKRQYYTPGPTMEANIFAMAQFDKNQPNRALAIDVLSRLKGKQYDRFFLKSTNDSSYSVAGAALEALARKQPVQAIDEAEKLQADAKGRLKTAFVLTSYLAKDTARFKEELKAFDEKEMGDKFLEANGMLYYAAKITNPTAFRKIAGAGIEIYQLLRFDYMGMQSTLRNSLLWLVADRTEKLEADSKNQAWKDQLKYLKDKLKLK